MKKLVIPKKKEYVLDEINQGADAFLFGIKDLAVHFEHTYSIQELKETIHGIKKQGKEVYLSLNRNYDHHDLKKVEACLQEIENLSVDGVFFYDLAILQLVQERGFSISLIWNQEHMTTNSFSARFYEKEGVKGISLSTNLTLQEIETIQKETQLSCFVPVFGYYPMFESKRHLVQNYLETFSLDTHYGTYRIEKEKKTYPIVDHTYGTTVYTSVPLHAIKETKQFQEMGISYVILSEQLLDHDLFLSVLNSYTHYLITGDEKEKEKVDQLLGGNYDLGFLYKETIYRVKKNG